MKKQSFADLAKMMIEGTQSEARKPVHLAAKKKGRQPDYPARKDSEIKRITVKIELEVFTALRTSLAISDLSQNQAVNQALKNYLGESAISGTKKALKELKKLNSHL